MTDDSMRVQFVPKTKTAIANAQMATGSTGTMNVADIQEFAKDMNAVAFNEEVYKSKDPEKLLKGLGAGSRGDIEAIKQGLGAIGTPERDITITRIENAVTKVPSQDQAETIATLEALRRQDPIEVPDGTSVSPTQRSVTAQIVSSLKAIATAR